MTENSLKTIFVAVLVLVVGISTYVQRSLRDVNVLEVTAELTNQGLLSGLGPVSLSMSLEWATLGTKYERKWLVNESINNNQLNIFIVDSESWSNKQKKQFPYLVGNAVADGDTATIIFDYQLIQTFEDSYSKDESWGSNAIYLAWVVAHEVGHIELEHRQSHFKGALGNLISYIPESDQKKRELEADRFFTDMVLNADSSVASSCADVMLELIRNAPISELSYNLSHPTHIQRASVFTQKIAESLDAQSLQEELNSVLEYHHVRKNEK